jgi:hypothetical protein
MASAPEVLAARALARFQAKVAARLGYRAQAAMARPMGPMMLLPAHSVSGSEVGGFFDSIGKAIGGVVKSPIFKSVASGVLKCVPVIGSSLGEAAPGMLDAAGNALGAAKGKKGGKAMKEAQRLLRMAQAASRKGNKKATQAVSMVKAAATVKTPAQATVMKGALAAGKLVKQAASGSPKARARITTIAERAGMGDRPAIEAIAMLAAVQRSMFPEEPQIYEPEEELDELDEYELEEEAVEGLVRSTAKKMPPKRAAALRRSGRASPALLSKLAELGRARPGYRRRAA